MSCYNHSGDVKCREEFGNTVKREYTMLCCAELTNSKYSLTMKTVCNFWNAYTYVNKSVNLSYMLIA